MEILQYLFFSGKFEYKIHPKMNSNISSLQQKQLIKYIKVFVPQEITPQLEISVSPRAQVLFPLFFQLSFRRPNLELKPWSHPSASNFKDSIQETCRIGALDPAEKDRNIWGVRGLSWIVLKKMRAIHSLGMLRTGYCQYILFEDVPRKWWNSAKPTLPIHQSWFGL